MVIMSPDLNKIVLFLFYLPKQGILFDISKFTLVFIPGNPTMGTYQTILSKMTLRSPTVRPTVQAQQSQQSPLLIYPYL